MVASVLTDFVISHQASTFFALALFFFLCVELLRRRLVRKHANPRNLPYPPGPKPLPIVGNIFDVAPDNGSSAYQHLAKQYGELVFLNVLGKHVLFVNTFRMANELFEKRSTNFSHRNESVMSNELMGWDFSFGHMRYGERWKAHRRMFHRQFQQSVAPVYWPIQRREAHALLRRLLRTPDDLVYHLRHNAAAVIMSISYGMTIAPKDDHYVALAEVAMDGMGKAATPGAFLVDIIPILKHMPEWVPGASFQRKAREWRKAVTEMKDGPFATTVKNFNDGKAEPSFVANLLSGLETEKNVKDEMEIIKNCAGMIYAAGAESTVSILASFVLAIVTHPEVQVKAQKELDNVVGRDRLPEFSDRQYLPYINAILKELLRWNPVAPLGLPHMATNHDEVNGYFIPAGTIIVGNTWGILHDPNTYPDPSRFNPDRFMGDNNAQHLSSMDPLSVTFGYGRRICPGRYMAEAQVWISVACMLSVFDMRTAIDERGNPIKVTPAFSAGMISHPLPFKFSMKPRGDSASILIEQTEFS